MQPAKHFLDLNGSESPEEVAAAYRKFEPLKARLDKYFLEMQPMIKDEKKGDIDDALRVAMEQIAELPKWVELREFLKANSDCVQNKIAKSTGLAGRDVARLIKTMERARVVTRKKARKTHLVRLAEIGR